MQSEAEIQKDIVNYLILNDYIVIRINSGFLGGKSYLKAYSLMNQFVNSPDGAKMLNPKFKSKGFSDLIAMKDGKIFFIEVKAAKGKQSDAQKEFEEVLKSVDMEYLLADCVKDVMKLGNFNE